MEKKANKSITLTLSNLNTRITNVLVKASDTVNHKILITKLDNYGIRGPVKQWFESYINDRKQVPKIENNLLD